MSSLFCPIHGITSCYCVYPVLIKGEYGVPFVGPQGWICPKCEAVMGPNFPVCWYCKPESKKDVRSEGE